MNVPLSGSNVNPSTPEPVVKTNTVVELHVDFSETKNMSAIHTPVQKNEKLK